MSRTASASLSRRLHWLADAANALHGFLDAGFLSVDECDFQLCLDEIDRIGFAKIASLENDPFGFLTHVHDCSSSTFKRPSAISCSTRTTEGSPSMTTVWGGPT